MNTPLIADNCTFNRRYTKDMHSKWLGTPIYVGIPEHQEFFNITSNHVRIAAWKSFQEQLTNNSSKFVRINPEDLAISFVKATNALLELNASAIHTQITSANSVVLKGETSRGNIYFEIFFDDITGWVRETVVNIFAGTQLSFNNSGSLDAMILAIKQYFGIEEINYLNIVNPATIYELSETTFTTTEF